MSNMSGTAQKLTPEKVIDIKRQLSMGEKQAVLSLIHGVRQPTISGIATGKIWKHVKLLNNGD